MANKPKGTVTFVHVPDPRGYKYALVDIDRLVPDPENPRIPVQESSLDTILALVRSDRDGLFNLARDIVEMSGTNPAELLSVSPVGEDYLVKEGNRRIAARRLLRNPEQLRDHELDSEVKRWLELSRRDEATKLPHQVFVVIGSAEDQDIWVDRKHLGPQDGRGPIPWDTQGKARRLARKTGTLDKTTAVVEGLKRHDPKRFNNLEPPRGTVTTLTRVLEFANAQAHIGIDTDEEGHPVLTQGERSLRLLEEILRDLRKQGAEKLTSRRIHNTQDMDKYLQQLDARIGTVAESPSITLSATSTPPSKTRKTREPKEDALRGIARPTGRRSGRIYDELRVARRQGLENASMVLARVLVELCIAEYATKQKLSIASDEDPKLAAAVKAFREQIGRAGEKIPKEINRALDFAATQPPSLSSKIEATIEHLIHIAALDGKEGRAKQREVREREIVQLLNDAVHRTGVVPTTTRVDHILAVLTPVLNAIIS